MDEKDLELETIREESGEEGEEIANDLTHESDEETLVLRSGRSLRTPKTLDPSKIKSTNVNVTTQKESESTEETTGNEPQGTSDTTEIVELTEPKAVDPNDEFKDYRPEEHEGRLDKFIDDTLYASATNFDLARYRDYLPKDRQGIREVCQQAEQEHGRAYAALLCPRGNVNNNNPRGRPRKQTNETTSTSKTGQNWSTTAEAKIDQRIAAMDEILAEHRQARKNHDNATKKAQNSAAQDNTSVVDSDEERLGDSDSDGDVVTYYKSKKPGGLLIKTPAISIPKWKKGDCWISFVQEFKDTCEDTPWDPSEYGYYLPHFLKDEALEGYRTVREKYGKKVLSDLDVLLKKVGKFVLRDTTVWKNKLNNWKLTMDMDLFREYEQMMAISKDGYPNATLSVREDIVKDKFTRALPEEIKKQITVARFGEYDLGRLAMIAESVRNEIGSTTESVETSSQITVKAVQTDYQKKNGQGNKKKKDLSNIQCHHCMKYGHYQNKCWDKQNGLPPAEGAKSNDRVGSLEKQLKELREWAEGFKRDLQVAGHSSAGHQGNFPQ